jgi:hypothetical protein
MFVFSTRLASRSTTCQHRTLTPADLGGIDLLVISDWDGAFTCGAKEINANLTPGEIATIEQFVASGGKLLAIAIPVGRSDEDNLPDLLSRFGLAYNHSTVGAVLEQPRTATARLAGNSYDLSLSRVIFSVGGGTSLIDYEGKSISALTQYRRGKVSFLGASWIISGDPEHGAFDTLRLNYPQAILSAQNASFFGRLVGYLTDHALPAQTEQEKRLWQMRLDALVIAFSGGTFVNDQPVGRGQADPAYVRSLRVGYGRGVRCDVTSSCVPFTFEPDDDRRLALAQQREDHAWDALERMRRLLSQSSPNLRAVATAHDEAVRSMNEAFALTAPIRRRPVRQPPDYGAVLFWGVGGVLTLLVGDILCVGLSRKRRKVVFE